MNTTTLCVEHFRKHGYWAQSVERRYGGFLHDLQGVADVHAWSPPHGHALIQACQRKDLRHHIGKLLRSKFLYRYLMDKGSVFYLIVFEKKKKRVETSIRQAFVSTGDHGDKLLLTLPRTDSELQSEPDTWRPVAGWHYALPWEPEALRNSKLDPVQVSPRIR